MSEVPQNPMEDLSFSESPSDSNPSAFIELDCSAELSLQTRPSDYCKNPNYEKTSLQVPPPIIYCGPEQSDQDSTEEKPKKASRSKNIKKIDVDRKKAIKQMRNRISAQRSRDRKRKEFDDMKDEADKLRAENVMLKGQLDSATKELEELRKLIAQGQPQKPIIISEPELKQAPKKVAAPILRKRCHFLFATLVLGYLCLTACVNPLINQITKIEKIPSEGIKLPANTEITNYNKENLLTSAQKARREFIENHSHIENTVNSVESNVEINTKIEEMEKQYSEISPISSTVLKTDVIMKSGLNVDRENEMIMLNKAFV